METRLDRSKAEDLKVKLQFEGMFCVERMGMSGGLMLFWRGRNSARLISYSRNHIDIAVNLRDMQEWRLTGYYGFPERSCRQQSWDLLRALKAKSDLPWVVMGDFNDLASHSEKMGLVRHPQRLIDGFNLALTDCGLSTLDMKGSRFTWEKYEGSPEWIQERLDRAVATVNWIDLFPDAYLFNINMLRSDHSALFLDLRGVRPRRFARQFKFENAWLLDDNCEQVVTNAWGCSRGKEFPQRLSECGRHLFDWGGDRIHLFRKGIERCRRKLMVLEKKRDQHSLAEYRVCQTELNDLLAQEETYWRQRSKQFWLRTNDFNTKYFHVSASARRKKNTFHRLKNEEGVWVDRDLLKAEILHYYEAMFTAGTCEHLDRFELGEGRVTDQQNESLLLPFTEEEVKRAIFSMNPDKSPGPDGMNPGFYQQFWNIIGKDLSDFVLSCLNTLQFPEGLNDTTVVLIPKKCIPERVADLRPISLCNVSYKVMAKMLTNRMKSIMGNIVSETQSAFVPGRLITDNILVASEVGHYLRRKQTGKVGCTTLKLDMSKAYDRMEWQYLRHMLLLLGFSERWVDTIMLCVTSVRYRFRVDGDLTDTIIPTRGLRQGDPLSPYLFILCAEGLSWLLQKSENSGNIHGCCVSRGAPPISHLFFADDSLLFFKANLEEAQRVKECLFIYEKASGQSVNFLKSSACFSINTEEVRRDEISAVFSVQHGDDYGKYLGLPPLLSSKKMQIYTIVENKIRQRIESWRRKFLSRAGKEILLKTVVQALPAYTMSVCQLPRTFCERMERVMNEFWWRNNSAEGGGMRWMSWRRMCSPKGEGGMGFRSLYEFNLALLGKQGWRLLTQPEALVSRVYKSRYFPQDSFLEAELGSNPSLSWRSIFAAQQLLQGGVGRRVGDGRTTYVWSHPWLLTQGNPRIETTCPPELHFMPVSALLRQNSWNEQLLRHLFSDRDANIILRMPVSPNVEDSWYWRRDFRGIYTVRAGYRELQRDRDQNHGFEFTNWKVLWKLNVPPNIKNFLWRCVRGVLPVRETLLQRGIPVEDVSCPVYHTGIETISHTLIHCQNAIQVWQASPCASLVDVDMAINEWLHLILSDIDTIKDTRAYFLLWQLWCGQNDVLWNGGKWDVNGILHVAAAKHHNWILATAKHPNNSSLPNTIWSPPSQGFIKCNFDASLFTTSGKVGYGAIIRNEHGGFVAACNGFLSCGMDLYMAEALACKEALSWLKARGDHKVVMETDCLNLCQAINGTQCDFSYIGLVISVCKNIMSSFTSCSIVHVRHNANTVTHALAQLIDAQTESGSWLDALPFCIQNLLS